MGLDAAANRGPSLIQIVFQIRGQAFMTQKDNIFIPGKDSNVRRDPAVLRKAASIDPKTRLPGTAPARGPLARKI